MQLLVDASMEILEFFPKCDKAYIVANVGGITNDNPIPISERGALYEAFAANTKKICWKKAVLIPQNLTPFPWIFGGQRHVNVFMMPDELADFAKKYNYKYCIDFSHLQMTCNRFGLNFVDSLELLLPYAEHLHIGDAVGTKGEGVQIGDGDIPWQNVWKVVSKYPNLSFIPEVWQGHKDHGRGFWNALDFLRQLK